MMKLSITYLHGLCNKLIQRWYVIEKMLHTESIYSRTLTKEFVYTDFLRKLRSSVGSSANRQLGGTGLSPAEPSFFSVFFVFQASISAIALTAVHL